MIIPANLLLTLLALRYVLSFLSRGTRLSVLSWRSRLRNFKFQVFGLRVSRFVSSFLTRFGVGMRSI